MSQEQTFKALLDYCIEQKISLTPLRKAVLQILFKSNQPLTAYEILEKLKAVHANAEAMTVYRVLDFFKAHHIVHRVESSHRYMLCIEPNHHHPSQALVCKNCHNIVEIEDKDLAKALKKAGEKFGFVLSHDLVELQGKCGDCH